MRVCLDSWAVLGLLQGLEPAASRVAAVMDEQRPVMSWINLGEVYYLLRRSQGEREADATIQDLRPALTPDLPSKDLVMGAARLKADHRFAYADAFAAATAIAHEAVLLTGDPELLLDGAPWDVEDLRGRARP